MAEYHATLRDQPGEDVITEETARIDSGSLQSSFARQGIRTSAVRGGDEWVTDGATTFITDGVDADVVLGVAQTHPEAGLRGVSLLLVERGS